MGVTTTTTTTTTRRCSRPLLSRHRSCCCPAKAGSLCRVHPWRHPPMTRSRICKSTPTRQRFGRYTRLAHSPMAAKPLTISNFDVMMCHSSRCSDLRSGHAVSQRSLDDISHSRTETAARHPQARVERESVLLLRVSCYTNHCLL